MHVEKPVAMHDRRRIRHWSRVQGCLVVVFLGVLLMIMACVGSLAVYIVAPPPATDIVIMGLDARGNEGTVTRTDSIILVGISPSELDVSLLSIPRDIFITVPGYGVQRINTINVLGEVEQAGRGPALLSSAIETSFGVGVDHYVRLDFQAFIALVDAIGGINVDVPYLVVDNAFPTPDYGTMAVRFEVGQQRMDGERALIYARTRHQDDDYRRAERQQQVITAISRKLANPIYWAPAWAAINRHTETSLTVLDMALLMPPMIFSAGDLNHLVIDRQYVVPADGVVVPNYTALNPYITDHFD